MSNDHGENRCRDKADKALDIPIELRGGLLFLSYGEKWKSFWTKCVEKEEKADSGPLDYQEFVPTKVVRGQGDSTRHVETLEHLKLLVISRGAANSTFTLPKSEQADTRPLLARPVQVGGGWVER